MELLNLYSAEVAKLPEGNYFKSRGMSVCTNDGDNLEIMIAGCNPGIYKDEHTESNFTFQNPFLGNPINYFARFCKFIPENDRHKVAYVDIFPFKEADEATLLANIRGQEPFMAKILSITEAEIERINPNLLIIANKGTWPYWGAAEDCIWMGYDFQPVLECDLPERLRGRNFDVRIIRGFRKGVFAERDIIYRPADGICKLKGTVTLMSKYIRNIPSSQQLTIDDYLELSAFAKQVKSISKYL